MSSTAHEFLAVVDAMRDVLFSRARAGAPSDRAAEGVLLAALRRAFAAALSGAPPAAAIDAELPPAPAAPPASMPADTYARLAAAVQVDAARTAGNSGLKEGHVLLSPDPLLAPKKPKPSDEPIEGLGFTPTSRFFIGAIVALIVGIILTTIIMTWHSSPKPPAPAPATRP